MGTLASGSIDLKSLKVAGSGATSYITQIDSDGIFISPFSQSPTTQATGNSVKIDGTGMEVYQNGISYAKYGLLTRIGRDGDASILIQQSGITGRGEDNLEFFDFSNSGVSVSTTVNYTVWSDVARNMPTTQADSISYTVAHNSIVDNVIEFRMTILGRRDLTTFFLSGVSQTKTLQLVFSDATYGITITFDGVNQFSNIYLTSNLGSFGLDRAIYLSINYMINRTAPGYKIGGNLNVSGAYSLAEGYLNSVTGNYSHVEGEENVVTGSFAHAEGSNNRATNSCTHVEGWGNKASASNAHAEGYFTVASGMESHSEGEETIASGNQSHAEGYCTVASGAYSHAQNNSTVATQTAQTVIGKYNAAKVTGDGTTESPFVYTNVGNYPFIIGNGTANSTWDRSNALAVDWNGNLYLDGDVYVNCNSSSANGTSLTSPIKTVAYEWQVSPAFNAQTKLFTASPDNSLDSSLEPSGYTFLSWVIFATLGWVGSIYPSQPTYRSTDIWTVTAKGATTGASIRGVALYIKTGLL